MIDSLTNQRHTRVGMRTGLGGEFRRTAYLSNLWGCPLVLLVSILGTFVGGCAVHHYDAQSGTEDIWGIGHMRMKLGAPSQGVRAVISGTDVVGLAGGFGDEFFMLFGWERESHVRVVDENTSVRLEWPNADLFNVRVGSELPSGQEP